MTKKDWLLLVAFVVAPAGFFAAGVYYGPKVKKWYADKKSTVPVVPSGDGGTDPSIVEIKKIDEVNKTITLSLNKNPDITWSYRSGGAPMAQLLDVPGIPSNEMALRYVDGKFMVTDGAKVLFEKELKQ